MARRWSGSAVDENSAVDAAVLSATSDDSHTMQRATAQAKKYVADDKAVEPSDPVEAYYEATPADQADVAAKVAATEPVEVATAAAATTSTATAAAMTAAAMTAAATATQPDESGAASTSVTLAELDVAAAYPEPTMSTTRLIDGSENWLPVPDAEATSPSDIAWRTKIPDACQPPHGAADAPITSPAPVIPAGCTCPKGRRPYHTILTAQASTYQRWQTLIFYHHFRKQQRLHPCTEMVGFTRLLASSNAGPDDLMNLMPTVTVSQLGFEKTRGFQVINRPWTLLEFLKMKEWDARITEDYVYIAETDHLLRGDIPNRATPRVNVVRCSGAAGQNGHRSLPLLRSYF